MITIVPRLNALLVINILPGNTGPPCNYKNVGGGGWGVPPPPHAPVTVMFIIWKLEWMKFLFKLIFNREIVTLLLEYNYFDYYFQVLFVNVTGWILLWILKLLSALNIPLNINHPEILRQLRFKWETEINWRGHKIFLEKVTGSWNN